jgi:NTP pyrophosphatase (non-canonical NTP hydrolase)
MPMLKPYLTFGRLRDFNVRRCESAFPMCKDWTAADWMTALVGEVGELANLLKKIKRGDEVDPLEVGKEIADVQTYLDLLAAHLGVDLGEATIQKFNEVSDRRGSGIKL